MRNFCKSLFNGKHGGTNRPGRVTSDIDFSANKRQKFESIQFDSIQITNETVKKIFENSPARKIEMFKSMSKSKLFQNYPYEYADQEIKRKEFSWHENKKTETPNSIVGSQCINAQNEDQSIELCKASTSTYKVNHEFGIKIPSRSIISIDEETSMNLLECMSGWGWFCPCRPSSKVDDERFNDILLFPHRFDNTIYSYQRSLKELRKHVRSDPQYDGPVPENISKASPIYPLDFISEEEYRDNNAYLRFIENSKTYNLDENDRIRQQKHHKGLANECKINPTRLDINEELYQLPEARSEPKYSKDHNSNYHIFQDTIVKDEDLIERREKSKSEYRWEPESSESSNYSTSNNVSSSSNNWSNKSNSDGLEEHISRNYEKLDKKNVFTKDAVKTLHDGSNKIQNHHDANMLEFESSQLNCSVSPMHSNQSALSHDSIYSIENLETPSFSASSRYSLSSPKSTKP